MNPIRTLKRHFANVERSTQLLAEIREGIANLTDVTNRHLIKLIEETQLANDPREPSTIEDVTFARGYPNGADQSARH
jgi:hypothetical protein